MLEFGGVIPLVENCGIGPAIFRGLKADRPYPHLRNFGAVNDYLLKFCFWSRQGGFTPVLQKRALAHS